MVDVAAIREFLSKERAAARVLIVDDEPAICSVIEMALEESGIASVTAGSAEEACEILESQTFELLVSDKNLPKMSGLELLRHSKECAPKMPMVMMTGYASMDTVKQAMSIGAIDYIAKPFDDIFAVATKLATIVTSRINIRIYEKIAAALLNEIRLDGLDGELSKNIGAKLGFLKKLLKDSPDVLVFDEESACIELATSFELADIDTIRSSTASEVLSLLDENPTLSVVVIAVDHPASKDLLTALKSERHLKMVLSSAAPNLKSTLAGFSLGAVDLYARDFEDSETLAGRIKHRIEGAQREQLYTRLFSILHVHSDLVDAELLSLIEELAPSENCEAGEAAGGDSGDAADYLTELSSS